MHNFLNNTQSNKDIAYRNSLYRKNRTLFIKVFNQTKDKNSSFDRLDYFLKSTGNTV